MTEKQAKEFRNKYIIADFEGEGHKTYTEYEKIKKSIK
tara:strand:- start:260 stop:373 length:114 start_codon:yes stop_codon:yes gene_type:complete